MDFEIVIEADLFFRRMDVDVQLLRRDRKKQERDRKPAVKQLLLISLIQSPFQDFTGYDPAVDAEDPAGSGSLADADGADTNPLTIRSPLVRSTGKRSRPVSLP